MFTPNKTKAILELADTIQEITEQSDGKLCVFLALTRMPNMPAVHPICLIFHDGPEDEARRLLAPLLDLGPAMSMVSMEPYADTKKNHQNL